MIVIVLVLVNQCISTLSTSWLPNRQEFVYRSSCTSVSPIHPSIPSFLHLFACGNNVCMSVERQLCLDLSLLPYLYFVIQMSIILADIYLRDLRLSTEQSSYCSVVLQLASYQLITYTGPLLQSSPTISGLFVCFSAHECSSISFLGPPWSLTSFFTTTYQVSRSFFSVSAATPITSETRIWLGLRLFPACQTTIS